jgi:hypothetical protein
LEFQNEYFTAGLRGNFPLLTLFLGELLKSPEKRKEVSDMGNLVEALIAGMGLMAGVMVFLTSLEIGESHWRGEEQISQGHPHTIHPDEERMTA